MNKVNLLSKDTIIKLRLDYDWETLFMQKEILYEFISNYLLSSENLFYFASQKYSTKTLLDTRKYISKLIEMKILDQELSSVLHSIGWIRDRLDITNTVFQGDLAEYLMCILIDKYTNISTIISKVSLKTTPGVPSFGNDNLFYDYAGKILYYGESKFYTNISSAMRNAVNSLELHKGIQEVQYIKSHTNVMISPTLEHLEEVVEKFDFVQYSEIRTKSIIFIINEDCYEKVDIEARILGHFDTNEKLEDIIDKVLFVFLPILSKNEFLEYLKGKLL